MKQYLRHFLAFLLAAFFLVSFTGFRLLVHHCLGCDTTEIMFAQESVSCCATSHTLNAHKEVDAAASCCHSSEQSQCGLPIESECCDLEVIYLKAELEGTPNKLVQKIEPPVFDVIAEMLGCHDNLLPTQLSSATVPTVDPPPRRVGKDFVLFAHHIKIA